MKNIKLNYKSVGNNIDQILLFVHPLGVDHSVFNKVMEGLYQDYTCYSVDIRGHGKSPVVEPPYSIDEMAEDISFTFSFDKPVNVMGVSIGGMIAMSLAIKKLIPIKKLILSDTGHVIGNYKLWQERIDLVNSGGLQKIVDMAIERWFPEEFRTKFPELMDDCKRLQLKTPVKGYVGACQAIQSANLTDEVFKIENDTLVINGTKDISTPPELGMQLKDLIPNGTFKELDGIGHVPPLQDPNLTIKILKEFLN
tara:strand:- start:7 stop:765 length:759 start_codon:yes stop_codon:yes gene_type:complete